MSKVVIGTWPLSGDFGHVELSQIEKTLQASVECGFNEFDTAPNYGNGFIEFCLGRVFYKKTSQIKINSKCGNMPFIGKSFKIEDIQKSVEQSLKRTGAECLNILYLHNPRTEIVDYAPYLELMNNLKREGKIIYSGLSMAKGTIYSEDVTQAFDFLQDDVNLLYQKPLENKKVSLKTYARSPLASGILGGHINRDSVFSADDQRYSWLKGERLLSIMKRVEYIQSKSDIKIDSLARKFLFQQKDLGGVIFGVKRPEHIYSIHSDMNTQNIAASLLAELESAYKNDFGITGEKHLSY